MPLQERPHTAMGTEQSSPCPVPWALLSLVASGTDPAHPGCASWDTNYTQPRAAQTLQPSWLFFSSPMALLKLSENVDPCSDLP